MEGWGSRHCTGKWGTVPEKLVWPSRSPLPRSAREKYQWYTFTLVSLDGIQPWGPQLDFKACYVRLTGKAIHVNEAPGFWLPQGGFLGHDMCKRPPRTVPEDTVVVVPLVPTHRGQKVKTGHGFPGCLVSNNCCDSWQSWRERRERAKSSRIMQIC